MNMFLARMKEALAANYYNQYPAMSDLPRRLPPQSQIVNPEVDIDYAKLFASLTQQTSLKSLASAYKLLGNDYSKKLFVDLLTLRILGNKVSLDIEKSPLWEQYYSIAETMKKTPFIRTRNFNLHLCELDSLGFDNLKMFYFPIGIFTDFVLKQYEFNYDGTVCKVENGDVVIDGGGCFGDTALYFAHVVGPTGKVFAFEFIRENMAIFQKNMALNPTLRDIISLVPNPLWSHSGEHLYITEDGPASSVSSAKPAGSDTVEIILTVSIDDFVWDNNLEKVDFIKLDIEGAELNALHGAEKTIKKFTPKLAICLYHNIQHFATIPAYLNSLGVDYTFSLGHYTPHFGETVLFATPNKSNAIDEGKKKNKESIVIIDPEFPQEIPFGFRNYEINGLLRLIAGCKSYTMHPMKPGNLAWFSHGYGMSHGKFSHNLSKYSYFYPENKENIRYLDPNVHYEIKLGYSYFLAETYVLLPFYNKHKIPFVFVLYPGGAFGLHNASSDAMLKEIFSSPYFRKVIVTQDATRDYLLNRGMCPEDKMEFLFAGYAQFLTSDTLPKQRFKQEKDVFDICFVAAKYIPMGLDKGYDLVIESAKYLVSKHSDIHFHIVGNYDAYDIDVSSIKDRIHFYGYQQANFLQSFYAKMDICLSPSRMNQLYEGNFHGFPLGFDCMFLQTALFVTDELNNNRGRFNERELVIIKPQVKDIIEKIEYYYHHLEDLYSLSKNGQAKVDLLCNPLERLGKVVDILMRV